MVNNIKQSTIFMSPEDDLAPRSKAWELNKNNYDRNY